MINTGHIDTSHVLRQIRLIAGLITVVLVGASTVGCRGRKCHELILRPGDDLAAATERIRLMRQRGDFSGRESIVVSFAEGTYPISKTWHLGTADGGIGGVPVVYRARPGARVRILGGTAVPVDAFSKVTDPQVLARLPVEGRDKVLVADVSTIFPGEIAQLQDSYDAVPNGPILYVNGKTMSYARWPNSGWAQFTNAVCTGVAPKDASPEVKRDWKLTPGAFVFDDPRAERWDFSDGVMLCGYWTHDWRNHCLRAAAYEPTPSNHVIRMAVPYKGGIAAGTMGLPYRRFYAYDLLEELDMPGEWHLDRKRKLLYLIPPRGEFAAGDEVRLTMGGDLILDVCASNVRFEGLEFGCSGLHLAKVEADDVVFDGCSFACCGGQALHLGGMRGAVRNCAFSEIGCGCVTMTGGDFEKIVPADSLVENCTFHDYAIFGRTYNPAVRLEGCGNTVRGCRIHDAPHVGIIFTGNESVIESNEVYRVLLETTDAGAIYTGRSWISQGNVVRYNYIHDIGTARYDSENGTVGLYFDDCDCGDEAYGNVFWRVGRGILVGGGRDHPIHHNIFAECNIGYSIDLRGVYWKQWNRPEYGWGLEAAAEKVRYREDPWKSRYPRLAKIMSDDPRYPKYVPVETNLFLDCREKVCELPGGEIGTRALANLVMRGNLVVNTVGTNGIKTAILDERAPVRAGFRLLNGSRAEPIDLGFVDASHGDFRLKADARLKMEMTGFDVKAINRN